MKHTPFLLLSILLACVTAVAGGNDWHLMRYADVQGDTLVFTYEGDLWLAPASGGEAHRVTRDSGLERYAKFSPDGSRIAFTAQYDDGDDVYVMDGRGGEPMRLTFHPARDRVLGWTADGKDILFRSDREYPFRGEEVYRISADGGMPVRLPVDRAGLASLSPDGKRIAYNRISREDRTWKRYRGGMAQDIWVGTLGGRDFHRVTHWEGTDNYPMWYGDGIYFVSDRKAGTMNLYRYDTGTGAIRALTSYSDYDVKYPSLGDGRIVYQYAESLYLLDLRTGENRKVPVQVPSDRVSVREEYLKASDHTGSFRLSPSGKRLLLEARGEILDIPAEEGRVRDLTGTSGAREKGAVWSPDGTRVAYLSDITGEEELYVLEPEGGGKPVQLTHGGKGYRFRPVWSPDGKHLLFGDKAMRLNLVDASTGKITVVDQGEYDDGWYRWGIQDYAWSPCGRWVAYSKLEHSLNESIFLYSLDTGERTRVTEPWTSDWSPSFDPAGKYLYFLSDRTFHPVMGFVDQTHVFLDMTLPYVVLLQGGQPSPYAPSEDPAVESSERSKATVTGGKKAEGKVKDRNKSSVTRIVLEGIGKRILPAKGVEPGNYFHLEATKDGFLYLAREGNHFLKYQELNDRTPMKLDLYGYNLKKAESRKLLKGINNYHPAPGAQKLVYRAGDTFGIVDVGKPAKVGDGKVSLDGVRFPVNRLREFAQIFNEAWRVQRDWFYDPGMNGVDWKKVGDKYRRFVPYCGNRADLNYLIGEMIAELNEGHTYIFGGDLNRRRRGVRAGLLGAEFDLPAEAPFYRIRHIIPGNRWNPEERSPLREPGCGMRERDYLIAVDGKQVPAGTNVYRFLENKAGKVVEISYNRKPDPEGAATCRVQPVRDESAIRYREWVEHNRAYVEEASGGKIGYLHVPDMMERGLIEFARAFYPQYYRQGFIVDDRYNTGGFVGDMIVDRLERRVWEFTKPREGRPIPDPERTFRGPLAVLINADTGSNGEYFAEAIRRRGLGTLIGMRTWGGAVGIEAHEELLDGAVTTPPQFAPYGLDGKWLIEGHGVDPDVQVENLPGDVLDGKDPQLDRAVHLLLDQLKEKPMEVPSPPPYPDKSRPGEGRGGQ